MGAQQHWHTNSFLSFLAKASDLLRFLRACDQAQTHARSVSHFDFQWLSHPTCGREGNYNSNNSLRYHWKISKCFLSCFPYQGSSERWQLCNWYFMVISVYYLFKLLVAFWHFWDPPNPSLPPAMINDHFQFGKLYGELHCSESKLEAWNIHLFFLTQPASFKNISCCNDCKIISCQGSQRSQLHLFKPLGLLRYTSNRKWETAQGGRCCCSFTFY